MPGILTIRSVVAGTIVLDYTAGATFDSGTIHQFRSDTGKVTTQAVIVGTNTFTNIPGGIQMIFWVTSLTVASAFIGITAPAIIVGTTSQIGAGKPVTLSWRTDLTSFISQIVGSDLERASVPVNQRGYWYQQRWESKAQNVRLYFSDFKLHARIHGRGQTVVT